MGIISLGGGLTLFLGKATFDKLMLPLVAFAAGSLLGGAFLHMIPAGLAAYGNRDTFYYWILAGFVAFFALEQLLHWHHCHRANAPCRRPLTYLILLGDGLHNFIGGLAIGGIFLLDIRVGIMAWLAAAAHELPQEVGDFSILVHGGWDKQKALLLNIVSASTFLLGGIVAYFISFDIDINFLIPFAAGNFIYIAAVDLVPEVNKHGNMKENMVHFLAFVSGVVLMAIIKLAF